MKKTQWIISIPLFAAMFFSCNNSRQETHKTPEVEVNAVTVKDSLFSFPVHAAGKLQSAKEIKLSFKTGGMIASIPVEEGETVDKGQILAQLIMDEIEANHTMAKLAKEKAQRDLDRVKNLYSDSVATLEQYQDVNTALQAAKAKLKIASFNLKHSTIKAPEEGIVLKIVASENEMVGAGTPVFLFGTRDKNWVFSCYVSDRDRVKLQPGNEILIQFDAIPDSVFTAHINLLGNFADPYTGTYLVESYVTNPHPGFASGLIGKAKISTGTAQSYPYIPLEALVNITDNTGKVYTLIDSIPKVKKVTIKKIQGELVIIESGLEAGERIITEGAHYIQPESKISLKKKE